MSQTQLLSLPARPLGPLSSILSRVAIAVGCVVLTTLLVWLERDAYHDANGTPLGWIDALYYSTVTLSTTGYGDITPITDSARLVNALVITPLRFIFLITLVGTTIEVLTKRSRDEFRAQRWRRHMQGHTVVIGYGVKGQSTVEALLESGIEPARIVVVDSDRSAAEHANKKGRAAVVGDATREVTLQQAKVLWQPGSWWRPTATTPPSSSPSPPAGSHRTPRSWRRRGRDRTSRSCGSPGRTS